VAGFIGSPAMNLIDAEITEGGARFAAHILCSRGVGKASRAWAPARRRSGSRKTVGGSAQSKSDGGACAAGAWGRSPTLEAGHVLLCVRGGTRTLSTRIALAPQDVRARTELDGAEPSL
jgi:ABC-type sugar transport system ATPase subunit